MGRELNRKQAKKEGKNVREAQNNKKEKPLEIKTFIIIIIAILSCFAILYVLTGVFVTKDIKWLEKDAQNNETNNSIKNKILGIDALKQEDNIYYVYFYDTKNEDSNLSQVVDTLLEKVYRVDLNDGFNEKYIGTPSGVVNDINDLKVDNPTVIKVEENKIIGFYSGEEINSLK